MRCAEPEVPRQLDERHEDRFKINTCMYRYQVQARVNGTWVKTVIFADNDQHARLIAQYQFGRSNVPFAPTKIG